MDPKLLTTLHAHGKYCDGNGELEDFVQAALEKHFVSLGFSSHASMPFYLDWTMSEPTQGIYLQEINRLKDKYKDRLTIYAGLEIDYIKNVISPHEERFTSLGLDFSIGSVHCLYDPNTDNYYGIDGPEDHIEHLIQVTFNGSAKKLVQAYYQAIRELLQIGGFSFLGHLDLIKKLNYNDRYFSEQSIWYRDEIEHTLTTAREYNQKLEVNTGGISRKYISEPYPSFRILKLCKTMDIPLLLNSDAHRSEDIDCFYPQSIDIIKQAGYRRLYTLQNGVWTETSI